MPWWGWILLWVVLAMITGVPVLAMLIAGKREDAARERSAEAELQRNVR
jgi:hypothetical protein